MPTMISKLNELSPADQDKLFRSITKHLRKTGWVVRVPISEGFVNIKATKKFKRIPGEPESAYADLLATFGSVKLAISVGKSEDVEKQQKALAREAGYRYINAHHFQDVRDFLINIK